jgi:hypothetical protein
MHAEPCTRTHSTHVHTRAHNVERPALLLRYFYTIIIIQLIHLQVFDSIDSSRTSACTRAQAIARAFEEMIVVYEVSKTSITNDRA